MGPARGSPPFHHEGIPTLDAATSVLSPQLFCALRCRIPTMPLAASITRMSRRPHCSSQNCSSSPQSIVLSSLFEHDAALIFDRSLRHNEQGCGHALLSADDVADEL